LESGQILNLTGQNWNSNFDWTKLEYGFDELENLEKSNNKKMRDVTDHGDGDEGRSESR
jgi:hypothetical protein